MARSFVYPLFIIGILFFVFGFLTWVNGILIPYFQICLELNNFQSTWVAFAAYAAYFVMAVPSARLLRYTGYKNGMFAGLIVMAAGTALFIPAAHLRAYPFFLTGLFITGSGLALLQTAANPYVAIIGPIESHAQRIGFMGLANKIAGLLSLAVFGAVFLYNADTVIDEMSSVDADKKGKILDAYALRIVKPYMLVTGVLLALAMMIYFSKLPEVQEEDKQDRQDVNTMATSALNYRHLVLGVITLFCSTACEVIPIDGIILYARALGIPVETSRHFAAYTLYAMIAGYAASALLIPRFLSQQKALLACAVWGLCMTLGVYLSSGLVSIGFMVLMGFSSAMLWGTIWGLSLRGLGRFTKTGAAMLLMAVIGGGLFPLLFGKLIDINPAIPQRAILLLAPCCVMQAFFALWGHQLKRPQAWGKHTNQVSS